jgi:hypothetical protein
MGLRSELLRALDFQNPKEGVCKQIMSRCRESRINPAMRTVPETNAFCMVLMIKPDDWFRGDV